MLLYRYHSTWPMGNNTHRNKFEKFKVKYFCSPQLQRDGGNHETNIFVLFKFTLNFKLHVQINLIDARRVKMWLQKFYNSTVTARTCILSCDTTSNLRSRYMHMHINLTGKFIKPTFPSPIANLPYYYNISNFIL